MPCLSAESEEFKVGVSQLAKIFQLPSHADHVLLFKAISILIEERLSPEAIAKAQQEKKGQTFENGDLIPLSKVDLGFIVSGIELLVVVCYDDCTYVRKIEVFWLGR